MHGDQKPRQQPELGGFGLKITSPVPVVPKPNIHSRPHAQAWSRDPNDGRTKYCNRNLTFDDFVPPDQLGVDEQARRMGATWDVVRAIVKLKRPLKKLRRVARRQHIGNAQPMDIDREMLLR